MGGFAFVFLNRSSNVGPESEGSGGGVFFLVSVLPRSLSLDALLSPLLFKSVCLSLSDGSLPLLGLAKMSSSSLGKTKSAVSGLDVL